MTSAPKSAPFASPRAGSRCVAFTWGLAEATFFFFVPDIYLTRVALRDLRQALLLCGWAAFGALVGAAALWFAGQRGFAPALLHLFVWIPGINDQLITETAQAVSARGAAALFAGAVKGEPVKLFAVHAGWMQVPLPKFLAFVLLARLGRFAATTLVAWVAGLALRSKSDAFRRQVHVLFWVAFYTFYFSVMR